MALTLLRFILIVPFAMCFFAPAAWAGLAMKFAFWIFVLASVTDYLDGWAARALNQVSALGAALDPIADKLLMATALILLVKTGTLTGLSIAGAAIIIGREILVSGLREAIAPLGQTLPVTQLAKYKTTVQLIAIAAMLATVPGGVLWQNVPELVLPMLFWLAVVLTIITGAHYSWCAILILRKAR